MALWNVRQTDEFQDWFDQANGQLQEDIVANVEVLRLLGPSLGRPKVDTIKGSKIKNLKELRFYSGHKVIRVFFVFDPERSAVLLVGGDKAGRSSKTFYRQMIDKSEKIYEKYSGKKRGKNEKK